MRLFIFLALVSLAMPGVGGAQSISTRPAQTITLDPARGVREVALPFQERFLIAVPVVEGTKEVVLSVTPTSPSAIGVPYAAFRPALGVGESAVSFMIPELTADEEYSVLVRYWLVDGTARSGASCTSLLAVPVGKECIEETYVGSTSAPFATHFDFDFGVVHAPTAVGLTGIALAVHYHPSPINKNTPSSLTDGDFGRSLSIFAGLSVVKVRSAEPAEKAASAGMPVLGIGVRVADPVRLLLGSVFFQQVDANPIIDRRRDKWAPIIGIALDFELKGLLGPLAAALGVK